MISALEAARYPFLAPLSGYRNEIGIGDRFLFSGAAELNPRTFRRTFQEEVVPRSPQSRCCLRIDQITCLAGARTRESANPTPHARPEPGRVSMRRCYLRVGRKLCGGHIELM